MIDLLTILLGLAGLFFITAGTVGMLRFPDLFCRLHALTKADNLGLGLIVFALALQSETWTGSGKLVLIWLLAMLAGSTTCYLIGNDARTRGESATPGGGDQ